MTPKIVFLKNNLACYDCYASTFSSFPKTKKHIIITQVEENKTSINMEKLFFHNINDAGINYTFYNFSALYDKNKRKKNTLV